MLESLVVVGIRGVELCIQPLNGIELLGKAEVKAELVLVCYYCSLLALGGRSLTGGINPHRRLIFDEASVGGGTPSEPIDTSSRASRSYRALS